jgi:hypothetical protein
MPPPPPPVAPPPLPPEALPPDPATPLDVLLELPDDEVWCDGDVVSSQPPKPATATSVVNIKK